MTEEAGMKRLIPATLMTLMHRIAALSGHTRWAFRHATFLTAVLHDMPNACFVGRCTQHFFQVTDL